MELSSAVIEARTFEPWKVEYMSAYCREQDIRHEEREIGRSEGIQIGKSEGIQIGREEGRLDMLFDLVNNGLLTYPDTAQSAGMSENEFRDAISSSDMIL